MNPFFLDNIDDKSDLIPLLSLDDEERINSTKVLAKRRHNSNIFSATQNEKC